MAAKRPTAPDPDKDAAQKTEFEETTVPVNVGMDKDHMAAAETQNRQVGVDDSKDIRATLHDAAEDMSKTVDIPVRHEAGKPLPAATKAAIADKDRPSGSTLGDAYPATPDPYGDDAVREVTVNGRTYTWRKGDEKSVPAEAVDIWDRMVEANTP